jgi:hypothetical protein
MVKLCVVVLVVLLSVACGGGGGSGSGNSSGVTPSATFRVKATDVSAFTGTWYAISYTIDGVETLPVTTRRCKIVFNADGQWTSSVTAINGANGVLIDTYMVNSENDFNSCATILSFDYTLENSYTAKIIQNYKDRTGTHLVVMTLLKESVDEAMVGVYDIDINTYIEHGQNTILLYGYKSASFEFERNGNCTVTFTKGAIPDVAKSTVVVRVSSVPNVYNIYETYETTQSAVGTITKINNIVSMNLTYSDNSLTTFSAIKR